VTELPNWPHWLIDKEDGDYYVRLIDVEARLCEVEKQERWSRARLIQAEAELERAYRQHTEAGKQHAATQKRLRELAVHSKVGWDKAKFWHEEAKRLGSTSVPDDEETRP
jgi:hypothetical protein